MRLSPEEREEFLNLHGQLVQFAAQQLGRQPEMSDADRVFSPQHIEQFLRSEAAEALGERQKRIVRKFSNFRLDDFYLVKQYKKHAVLMDLNTLYGVVGVDEGLADMTEYSLPVPIRALLLPYRKKIVQLDAVVCNGDAEQNHAMPVLSRSDIEYDFKQIKAVRGITEILDPAVEQPSPAAQRAERELRQHLKSAATRDKHAADIKRIISKHPELRDVYIQLYSKVSAKDIKKELKANGVRGRHFAVYNNSVVAIAPTRGELLDQLSDLSFDGMMGQCALFRL